MIADAVAKLSLLALSASRPSLLDARTVPNYQSDHVTTPPRGLDEGLLGHGRGKERQACGPRSLEMRWVEQLWYLHA